MDGSLEFPGRIAIKADLAGGEFRIHLPVRGRRRAHWSIRLDDRETGVVQWRATERRSVDVEAYRGWPSNGDADVRELDRINDGDFGAEGDAVLAIHIDKHWVAIARAPVPESRSSRRDAADGAAVSGPVDWLPEPMIAAKGCDHTNDIAVDLASDARLMMREELLLARRGEAPGAIRQQLRVTREGRRPLLAQDLSLGGDAAPSPAVVGRHRAIGSMLVVDPEIAATDATDLGGDGMLLPLAGPGAVLAHALADDSLELRSQLTTALTLLGTPWEPQVRHAHAHVTRPSREAP